MTNANNKPLPDFDTLWDFSNPSGTEKTFTEILQNLTEENNTEYKLQLLTQIARSQDLQRKYEEAQRTLDTVRKQMQSPLTTVRFHLEQGRIFNSSRQAQQATPHFLEAYETALKHHFHIYAVDAAHMMAIALPNVKDQLHWNTTAIKLAEQSGDAETKKWLGSLYNNTAWAYHDSNDFQNALLFFNNALQWFEKFGNDSTIRIAKWSVGRCYRSMGETEKALNVQTQLETSCKQQGVDIDGYHAEELGELLLNKGNTSEAKAYFKIAFDLLSKDEWLVSNEKERIERLKKLSF